MVVVDRLRPVCCSLGPLWIKFFMHIPQVHSKTGSGKSGDQVVFLEQFLQYDNVHFPIQGDYSHGSVLPLVLCVKTPHSSH